MRIIPVLTAVLAAAALYGFLIEREAVLGFVRGSVNGGAAPRAEQPATAEEAPAEAGSATDRIVRVIAIRSTAEPVESGVTIRGQTEALRFVDVRSQSSGIVVSEPRRKGSFVTESEAVCTLDPGASKAELAEAEARLEEAKLNERTATQLAEGGFATETRRNAAKAILESAEAAYERAQDAIDKLTMTAPFDGLLESDAAELGSLLQPGSLCARIIQLNPINVVGYISELEVEKIKIGDPARVRFLSGRTASGTVRFVSRSADSDTRTFRIDITVANSDFSIRDGSAAEVFVATDNEMAHLLPQSVLTLNDAGRLGVRTVDGETARFFAVGIIRDTTGGVWVNGLPEQIDVIVVGHEYVIDGTPVTAFYRDNPA